MENSVPKAPRGPFDFGIKAVLKCQRDGAIAYTIEFRCGCHGYCVRSEGTCYWDREGRYGHGLYLGHMEAGGHGAFLVNQALEKLAEAKADLTEALACEE